MAKLIVPEKELLNKRKVDKDRLKKCPECHRVWERHYQTKTIRRYIDFPAFGLKKEICNSCKTSD